MDLYVHHASHIKGLGVNNITSEYIAILRFVGTLQDKYYRNSRRKETQSVNVIKKLSLSANY